MAVQMRDPSKAAGLFEGWEETMIWSCLQNVMGSVYADSLEHPTSALAVLGDFYFLAGGQGVVGLWDREESIPDFRSTE